MPLQRRGCPHPPSVLDGPFQLSSLLSWISYPTVGGSGTGLRTPPSSLGLLSGADSSGRGKRLGPSDGGAAVGGGSSSLLGWRCPLPCPAKTS